MKVYICGPMRNRPDCNFAAFEDAARIWRALGHTVYSPAEHDWECGINPSEPMPPDVDRQVLPWDVERICESDALALLPGWGQSTLGRVEVHLALSFTSPCALYNADTAKRIPAAQAWAALQFAVARRATAERDNLLTTERDELPTEVLPSGCVRQITGGRGTYELLSPFVLERDAKLYEWGARAENRGHRNWEKGAPFSRCVQSMFRHLVRFMMRKPDKPGEDNLAAVRFWAGAIMHYQEMIRQGLLPPELDDLPTYDAPA